MSRRSSGSPTYGLSETALTLGSLFGSFSKGSGELSASLSASSLDKLPQKEKKINMET